MEERELLGAIILSVIAILCSCEMAPISFAVYAEIPDLGLKTVPEVITWVSINIEYVAEKSGENDWQNPGVTYYLGTGDCEDYATLSMYLIHRLGIESRVIRGTKISTDIGHFWVEAEGNWWESIKGRMCNGYIDTYKDFTYYDYDYLLGEYEL